MIKAHPTPLMVTSFWHIYYDEDNVLGWPLKPLSDEYRNRVKDHEMNAGSHWYEAPIRVSSLHF